MQGRDDMPDPGLIRLTCLLIPPLALGILCAWRKPDARTATAGLLAVVWNMFALLLIQFWFGSAQWWTFGTIGGHLLGFPVDLCIGWAVLWGPLILVALPRTPLLIVAAMAAYLDICLMPLLRPVVQLGPGWLSGELVCVICSLVPSQLMARWTRDNRQLEWRVFLQVLLFASLILIFIPAIAVENRGGVWTSKSVHLVFSERWMLIPALIGLTAFQEFATKGGGTVIPFDPPVRLVTSGIYAYLRNPMQTSACVLLLGCSAALRN